MRLVVLCFCELPYIDPLFTLTLKAPHPSEEVVLPVLVPAMWPECQLGNPKP